MRDDITSEESDGSFELHKELIDVCNKRAKVLGNGIVLTSLVGTAIRLVLQQLPDKEVASLYWAESFKSLADKVDDDA